jgi:protein TonB
MRSELVRPVTGYQPGSPRQRAVSTVLSAGVILLVLLAAIYGSGIVSTPEKRSNPVTFDVAARNDDDGAKAEEKKPKAKKQRKVEQKHQAEVKPPQVTPKVEEPVKAKPAFTFLKLSHDDFAAADIGKMKSSGPVANSGDSEGAGGTYGPGEGPGGAVLYRAQWFHEPSNAQLGGYLPATAPSSGWGEIACQTIEDYRVENCQILAESPRGSGFGRAVQDAAWQFQVVPPRINGKPQLGTWVRIRIDYGTKRAG